MNKVRWKVLADNITTVKLRAGINKKYLLSKIFHDFVFYLYLIRKCFLSQGGMNKIMI